jgi:hypothetical protein
VRLRRVLLVGFLLGAFAAPVALAGAEPTLRGASFEVAAIASPWSIRGSGTVDVDAPRGGDGSFVERGVRGGRKVSLELEVTTWHASVLGSVTTLVLGVRVAESSIPASCSAGSRGTVTLVDSPGGEDTVKTAFRRASCRTFARLFGHGAGGVARVEISVIRQRA